MGAEFPVKAVLDDRGLNQLIAGLTKVAKQAGMADKELSYDQMLRYSRHIMLPSIELEGLWNGKPLVTEDGQVFGSPPLVSEAWFMAQVSQRAPNEARPFL